MVDTCPICSRPLGSDINEHHLIPKTFKGRDKIVIHRICHDTLHRTFTEREMQHYYHTIERILENETIQKFIKWVSRKDPDFYIQAKETNDRRRKRH